jgi:hypothetical protein
VALFVILFLFHRFARTFFQSVSVIHCLNHFFSPAFFAAHLALTAALILALAAALITNFLLWMKTTATVRVWLWGFDLSGRFWFQAQVFRRLVKQNDLPDIKCGDLQFKILNRSHYGCLIQTRYKP